jgi:hypothetical protein
MRTFPPAHVHVQLCFALTRSWTGVEGASIDPCHLAHTWRAMIAYGGSGGGGKPELAAAAAATARRYVEWVDIGRAWSRGQCSSSGFWGRI